MRQQEDKKYVIKRFEYQSCLKYSQGKIGKSPNFNKVAKKYHIMKVPPMVKSKKVK